jgi:hypothetical protein
LAVYGSKENHCDILQYQKDQKIEAPEAWGDPGLQSGALVNSEGLMFSRFLVGYFRMQSATIPAVPHLAPAVPCMIAEPSLQIAETRSSPSLQAIAPPDAST